MKTTRTDAERLAAKLVRNPNGCLEWVGHAARGGYGQMWFRGSMVRTHRIAWELEHGPIPNGLHVLHHCDNPPCCDAIDTEHHLFLGTHADNMADMVAKGRGHPGIRQREKTHCPQGHEYTAENTYVDKIGRRSCRVCKRDAYARFQQRAHEKGTP